MTVTVFNHSLLFLREFPANGMPATANISCQFRIPKSSIIQSNQILELQTKNDDIFTRIFRQVKVPLEDFFLFF